MAVGREYRKSYCRGQVHHGVPSKRMADGTLVHMRVHSHYKDLLLRGGRASLTYIVQQVAVASTIQFHTTCKDFNDGLHQVPFAPWGLIKILAPKSVARVQDAKIKWHSSSSVWPCVLRQWPAGSWRSL